MALNDYYVPDYLPDFSCKCGQCRHTCCQGWHITFSMQEYFRLLGLACSPYLRRKLDSAFYIDRSADPARYATISPNWRGECPLLDENGLCLLQNECGEQVMSGVCKYYPRTPKARFGRTCACSASCEKVLEMLYGRTEPIRLVHAALDFDLPLPEMLDKEAVVTFWQEMRKKAMEILQMRTLSLPERLQCLSQLSQALVPFQKKADAEGLLSALRAFDSKQFCPDLPAQRPSLFGELLYVLGWLCEDSQSMGETWAACCEQLGIPVHRGDATTSQVIHALEVYTEKSQAFARLHADWEIYFEHMLVNHLLVDDYPFSERRESLLREQEALCLAYAVLRFFGVMCIHDSSRDALVDVHACCFHLIEHSNFDDVAPRMADRLLMDGKAVQALTVF